MIDLTYISISAYLVFLNAYDLDNGISYVIHSCVSIVINGEKAAVNNPVFTQKRERTLEMLIKNLYLDYMPEVWF